jgi:hypothetical protein
VEHFVPSRGTLHKYKSIYVPWPSCGTWYYVPSELQGKNCKARIARQELQGKNCKARIASQELHVKNCKSRIASQELQVQNCKSRIAKKVF